MNRVVLILGGFPADVVKKVQKIVEELNRAGIHATENELLSVTQNYERDLPLEHYAQELKLVETDVCFPLHPIEFRNRGYVQSRAKSIGPDKRHLLQNSLKHHRIKRPRKIAHKTQKKELKLCCGYTLNSSLIL